MFTIWKGSHKNRDIGRSQVVCNQMNVMLRSSVRVSVLEAVESTSIPTYFQCPVSLELMRDPVTLSTGHTYDRSSIERWFHEGKNTCPQTRCEVDTKDLIPNLTLRNCIRNWQMNQNPWIVIPRNNGPEFPTRPRPLNEEDVRLMLEDIRLESNTLENLKTLRIIAKSSHRNRQLVCDGGVLPVLGSILSRSIRSSSYIRRPDCVSFSSSSGERKYLSQMIPEEALGALVDLSAPGEIELLPEFGFANLPALAWFLRKGSSGAKIHAVRIVESFIEDDDLLLQLGTIEGLIPGLIGVIRDHRLLPRALRSSLRSLYAICLLKKNRSTAAEAGAIAGVIELIPSATRKIAELALAFLNLMSKCSEGRYALQRHALCIPILVKSIAAYSNSATEHAVHVIHFLLIMTNHVADRNVFDEAITYGLIANLLLIYSSQVPNTSSEIRQKTRELLKKLAPYCHDHDSVCVRTIRCDR